ncbi:hypothetical protein CEE37_12820 [candidate division LCP-89 bacterium B3_LCP]|uniref:Signal transduction histidine kinase dimerisation/phosphoacceptor domain-containing protein n=1 Tax=candidate division LCP-89 bacterium B3_LCP TaxID=2012998 RepID=A0A532UTX1_UNCL8|nr:MAG: hypothetical protein CEE37_12820 [candidate division LCP-89 bacterium B3_LCP]
MNASTFQHCPLVNNIRDFENDREPCTHCSIPFMILDSQGTVRKVNHAFIDLWKISDNDTVEESEYNIFDDPILNSGNNAKLIKQASAGKTVELKMPDYSLPASFGSSTDNRIELHQVKIFIMGVMVKRSLGGMLLSYSCESQSPDVLQPEREGLGLDALVRSFCDFKHQINNPLLLIIGHAQLLMTKCENLSEENAYKLEKILSASEKIRMHLNERENELNSIYSKTAPELSEDLLH